MLVPFLGCATPRTVVEVPPCADRIDVTGQARRVGARRLELDHTFDLAMTKTELVFKGRGEAQTLVLDNDRPDALRTVVGAGGAALGALLLGASWWEVTAGGRTFAEAGPFYEAVWGGGLMAVSTLVVATGWHPARSYVEWQGVCPAGDAAPSLDVEEHR